MSARKSKNCKCGVSRLRSLKVDAEATTWPWFPRRSKRFRPKGKHRAGLGLIRWRAAGLRPLSISL